LRSGPLARPIAEVVKRLQGAGHDALKISQLHLQLALRAAAVHGDPAASRAGVNTRDDVEQVVQLCAQRKIATRSVVGDAYSARVLEFVNKLQPARGDLRSAV
jgi:hypothetical protein